MVASLSESVVSSQLGGEERHHGRGTKQIFVAGNKRGIFTRDRLPKLAARLLRFGDLWGNFIIYYCGEIEEQRQTCPFTCAGPATGSWRRSLSRWTPQLRSCGPWRCDGTGGAGYGAAYVQHLFCEFRMCQGIFSSAALCCVKGYIILNTFPFSSS